MEQEGNLICTASGGYPEEKLYWASKGGGANLTHKSTSQSVKNEDGSFSLSNTLQLESAPSETEYCCIFNHTRVPNRQPGMFHFFIVTSVLQIVNNHHYQSRNIGN